MVTHNEHMRIVVLTGAGISAESGVRTFRDSGGLWEGHAVQDVATPEGFARDPALVQRFYDTRRRAVREVSANPAHRALARLEQVLGHDLVLVTQNIDDLHERAGSQRVIHMHGELNTALCVRCNQRTGWHQDLLDAPPCPACGQGVLRPDVVWFGEVPYGMDRIEEAVSGCDLFVAIGTSGAVYPAAGYVAMAASYGAHTLELNLARTEASVLFDQTRAGPASQVVPQWVDELLAGAD